MGKRKKRWGSGAISENLQINSEFMTVTFEMRK